MQHRTLVSLFLALALLLSFGSPAVAQDADIVDTAIAAGDFTILVAAVEAAGLVDALKGDGPFTVFAPTDAAFNALPEGTIPALLADPSGDLTQILLYHVLDGKVMAAEVTDGLEVTMLQGSPVVFSVADGVAKINDATIIVTDIETSNGVIHVIDAVILPPAEMAEATATPVAEEEPAATETPVAEEEAAATETPVAEEEAAATATPVAEEEPAATATPVAEEEAPAPEVMPETGGNFGSNPLIFVVIAAAVVGLAGGVWMKRRRA